MSRPQVRLPASWAIRLADLAAVAAAWAVTEQLFPAGAGWRPYALALVCWGAGLALTRSYRSAGPLFTALGKLALDQLILTAAWAGLLYVWGVRPGATAVGCFALAGFASLALVRAVAHLRLNEGESRPTLVAGDALLSLAAFYALNGLWWGYPFPASLLACFLVGRLAGPALLGLYRLPAGPAERRRAWQAWLLAQAIYAATLLIGAAVWSWPQTGPQLLLGAGAMPVAIGLAWRAMRGRRGAAGEEECARRLALAAAALVLMHPYLTRNLVCTADAKFYAEAMQDYLAQLKLGIFPVWVSQTAIAPYGAVFPFHMASYHFYLGALVDLLTGGTLNVYAVQHVTLVLSLAGGAAAMYAALTALAPGLRWESAALAFLYVACPAWLGALYGLDMFFTFMTLPWLALLAYALALISRRTELRDYALLGGAAAMVWLTHSPVGFWASLAAMACLLAGWARQRPGMREWAGLGLAAAIGLSLCVGLFVSLYTSRISGDLVDPSGAVLKVIREAAPAEFLPVSHAADRLSDLQIGYALQLLLLVACFRRGAARGEKTLAWIAFGMLLLVYPVPGVTAVVWRHLPWIVMTITNVWPMQRIDPVVAALIPVAALPALAAWGNLPARRALLALLCLWSGLEASKFVHRGYRITQNAEMTRVASKLENSPARSSWFGYAPWVPPLPLVDRVNDPRLFNRLLAPDRRTELLSNLASTKFSGETPPGATFANAVPAGNGVLRLEPGIALEPSRHYLLTLRFLDPAASGILQVVVPDIAPRFYQEIRVNGGAGGPPIVATVWTSEPQALAALLLFTPDDRAAALRPHARFLAYRLAEYDPLALPIRVSALAPYVAILDAPRSGFLETHRIYTAGYRATVNGQAVAVAESPSHLVMLPVTAGRDEVRLVYVGVPAALVAYWISFGAAVLILASLAARSARAALARFRLPPRR